MRFLLTLSILVGSFFTGSCAAQAGAAALPTVAIWPFESHSVDNLTAAARNGILEEVVPEMLGAEVASSGYVRLVERLRLADVLREQQLGTSEIADEKTRLRLGRLVGARWMIFGSQVQIGTAWQMDVRLVDVESSRVIATGSATGQRDDYVAAVQSIARQLVARLK